MHFLADKHSLALFRPAGEQEIVSSDEGSGSTDVSQNVHFSRDSRAFQIAGRLAFRRAVRTVAVPLLTIVALVAGWQVYVTTTKIEPSILPGPLRVLTQGWLSRQDLLINALPTLQETLAGFALSILLSAVIATACDFAPWLRHAVDPLMVVSQTIPIVAIAPLFVIWFGFASLPKALLVALATFFPVVISLLSGFDATPPEATDLLRSMGASRWKRFIMVRLPTAVPFFLSGLRISITYAVVGAIFAEYVGAETGLGIFMQTSQSARRTDLVLAAIGVSSLMTLALYGAVVVVEMTALRRYRAAHGRRAD